MAGQSLGIKRQRVYVTANTKNWPFLKMPANNEYQNV
jgi:hypothetical protein